MDVTPPPITLAAARKLAWRPGRSAEAFIDGDLEVRFTPKPTNGMQPPHERVEFEIKTATGMASFGQLREALHRLEIAVKLGEAHALGQLLFEAETLLKEMRTGAPQIAAPQPVVVTNHSPELTSAIEGLAALRAVGARA